MFRCLEGETAPWGATVRKSVDSLYLSGSDWAEMYAYFLVLFRRPAAALGNTPSKVDSLNGGHFSPSTGNYNTPSLIGGSSHK